MRFAINRRIDAAYFFEAFAEMMLVREAARLCDLR